MAAMAQRVAVAEAVLAALLLYLFLRGQSVGAPAQRRAASRRLAVEAEMAARHLVGNVAAAEAEVVLRAVSS